MTCIGHLTHSIRNATTDLADAWITSPRERGEFGERELADIKVAAVTINLLLSAIETTERSHAA